MPRICYVTGCNSGYPSCSTKHHFFKVPKDNDMKLKWERAIPRDAKLGPNSFVCDVHFQPHEIITKDTFVINGETVELMRDRPRLMKDAIPSIFPNLPKYLSKKSVPKRAPPRRRQLTSPIQDILHKEENIRENATVTNPDVPNAEGDLAMEIDNSSRVRTKTHNQLLKERCYNLQKQIKKVWSKIRTFSSKIKSLEKENKELKNSVALNKDIMAKLPRRQQLIIEHIIRLSNCKTKSSMKYETDWILDCLLLRIKSSKTYEFMRINQYLPLPTFTTLQSYIKAIPAQFGFDSSLFEMLKLKLKDLPDRERKGILMFDEMKLRPHIEYREHSKSVVGTVDYGNFTRQEDFSREGDHALVFLFQPFLGGWVQTVGTFCSAGSAPATVLAKLLLQCIIILENCAAEVFAIVSDGATTNRSALSILGISGKKENTQVWFPNPFDNKRKVYAICDVPHLIKCIRNNLLKAGKFIIPEGEVQHSHLVSLWKHEQNLEGGLRAVPKLTYSHLYPNGFQKMSVNLAVQLFSKSCAHGMEFYQSLGKKDLIDSYPTVFFIKQLDKFFDIMNAKLPQNGIRKESEELQFLQEMLNWVNRWEENIRIQPPNNQCYFLSQSTLEGLRITLTSAIKLINELLAYGFNYVLTNRLNQDPLERFFGIIRQSGGGEDHPTSLHFIYLYRLLSTCSLIKPPKRSNIALESPAELLVKMKELSGKKQSERENAISYIEKKLEQLLLNWENQNSDHIIMSQVSYDHNYFKPEASDALVCYLGGYVGRKMARLSSCLICKTMLFGTNISTQTSPNARLINLKTEGGLLYPSQLLHSLLSLCESVISKHFINLSKNFDIDLVFSEILENPNLVAYCVGCEQHRETLTSRIIHFYVVIRIHFFTRQINRERSSAATSKNLRKISKL